MKVHQVETIAAAPAAPGFVDLTDDVSAALSESGVWDGQVTVFAPHSSCALIVNEKESGLLEDIKRALERVAASPAAARNVIGSSSVVLPACGGALKLGTWQRVMLVELEQPDDRSVVIQVIGE